MDDNRIMALARQNLQDCAYPILTDRLHQVVLATGDLPLAMRLHSLQQHSRNALVASQERAVATGYFPVGNSTRRAHARASHGPADRRGVCSPDPGAD